VNALLASLLPLARRGLAAAALALGLLPSAAATALVQTNLVSNIPGLAAHTDPNLRNPWGIAENGSGPFWISDNHTGLATTYDTTGTPLSTVVTIPAPGGGMGAPTGAQFNGDAAAFGGAHFLFATEDGTIAAWNGGSSATLQVITPDGEYKGLANVNDMLYATDFTLGRVDVFDSAFAPTLPGSFVDPNLPAGYSPFGIREINGDLYVTYAILNPATGDDVAGAGNGLIDVFDTNGNLVHRLVSPGGALNSPWGLTLVPAGFGAFAGDLLVGNFGDGLIHAYDPTSGAFLGTLTDEHGQPFQNDGLWALQFGNGGMGGRPNTLYLTAGLNDESDGLFAAIHVPEPGSLALMAIAVAGLALVARRASR
jgi:uncharacterized protein (TIGR03118 family)